MKRIIILFIFIALFTANIKAQPFSLDTSFNVNYNFNPSGGGGNVYGLNYEQDGKLIIYGSFWDDIHNISDVLRIYEDGSLDNTWQFMGSGASEGIGFVKWLNNEYILFATSGSLGKCTYYGQNADTAWSNNVWRGNICHGFYQPYIFSDGSMLVGTDSICNIVSNKKRWFMKFFSDGTVDTNFKHSPNGYVFGIVKYSSDKLLLYGGSAMHGFTRYDSTQINRMCRIDTLGNLDTTFKSVFIGGNPRPLYIQNDGKIIVCGGFYIINNPYELCLIRLNADGSLDSTFNNFNLKSIGNGVGSVCPTTDGGYLIGGGFKQYQGYTRSCIVKTDINGYIDTAYFNGQGIDSTFQAGNTPYVGGIVKGTNDTYYVMGYFTYYNSVKVNPIIRIHGLSVGINEVEKEKGELKVFPNPAKEFLTAEYSINKPAKEVLLLITDMQGRLLIKQQLTTKTNQALVDVRNLKSGSYLCTLMLDGKQKAVAKVIIEH